MNKMKCPFCQQELATGNYYVHCHNPHCNITAEMEGTEEMWQELIRTKKQLVTKCNQLDVAVDALKQIKDGEIPVSLGIYMDINDALEQITAEQKDVK